MKLDKHSVYFVINILTYCYTFQGYILQILNSSTKQKVEKKVPQKLFQL